MSPLLREGKGSRSRDSSTASVAASNPAKRGSFSSAFARSFAVLTHASETLASKIFEPLVFVEGFRKRLSPDVNRSCRSDRREHRHCRATCADVAIGLREERTHDLRLLSEAAVVHTTRP